MGRISTLVVTVALAFSVSSPGVTLERNGNVAIKFAGERDWTAECTFVKANGKERKLRRSGRGNSWIDAIGMRGIQGGKCTVTVPENAKVKVTFEGTGLLVCPFESGDPCVDYYIEAGEHTFSF
jgi:hypothetical protein